MVERGSGAGFVLEPPAALGVGGQPLLEGHAWGVAAALGQVEESRAAGLSSAGPNTAEPPRAVHVRGVNPRAAALLEQGATRSATFKRLLDTVEQSDLVVHVDTGYAQIPSRLGFAAATPAGRFLRITLTVSRD